MNCTFLRRFIKAKLSLMCNNVPQNINCQLSET